jgi:hypothetical protein
MQARHAEDSKYNNDFDLSIWFHLLGKLAKVEMTRKDKASVRQLHPGSENILQNSRQVSFITCSM